MYIFKFILLTCLTFVTCQFNLITIPKLNRYSNKIPKINTPNKILKIQVGPKLKVTNESILNFSQFESTLSNFDSLVEKSTISSIKKQTDLTNQPNVGEKNYDSNKSPESNEQAYQSKAIKFRSRTSLDNFKSKFPNINDAKFFKDQVKSNLTFDIINDFGNFTSNAVNNLKNFKIVSEFLNIPQYFKIKNLKSALDYMLKYGHLENMIDINKPEDILNLKSAFEKFQDFFGITKTGLFDQNTVNLMNLPRCGLPDKETKFTEFAGTSRGALGLNRLIRKKRYELFSAKYEFTRNLTWTILEYSKNALRNQDEKVINVFKEAFEVWSNVTNLNFKYKERATKADILIGFYSKNHGNKFEPPFDGPNGTLAHTSYPQEWDLHIDDDENWSLYPKKNYTDLFTVSIHEIGHKLGLKHTNVKTACLFPIYNSKSTHLDADDIQGIQSLYGAKYDHNVKENEMVDADAIENLEEDNDPADNSDIDKPMNNNEEDSNNSQPSTHEFDDFKPENDTTFGSRPNNVPKNDEYKSISILKFKPKRNIFSRKKFKELTSMPCQKLHIDSSVCLRNNKCLVIAGDQNFWINSRLKMIKRKKEQNNILFKDLTGKVDSIYRDNELIHIIQGKNVTTYDSFYARPINRTTLEKHFGLPKHVKHVHSVFKKLSTGVIYIYSGELYWRFTKAHGLEKIPRLTFIFGLPANIQSVLHFNNGRSVYIKNKNYWIFDENSNQLLSFIPGNLADLDICKDENFNILNRFK